MESDLLRAETVDAFAREIARVVQEHSFDAKPVIGRFVALPSGLDTVAVLNPSISFILISSNSIF